MNPSNTVTNSRLLPEKRRNKHARNSMRTICIRQFSQTQLNIHKWQIFQINVNTEPLQIQDYSQIQRIQIIRWKRKWQRTYESGAQTRTSYRLVETRTWTSARNPGASIPSSLVTMIFGRSPELTGQSMIGDQSRAWESERRLKGS